MLKQDTNHGVRSVLRSTNIISCLSKNINTLNEIAEKCGIKTSTAYRILKTLELVDFVTQDPRSHRYYLGPAIIELSADSKATHQYLIICAQEEMRALNNMFKEAILLSILVDVRLIHLFELQGTSGLRVVEDSKGRGQPFIGATAKILLAQLADEQIKSILDNIKIAPLTENSVTDKEELLSQVLTARRQGYAISYGERVQGALGISSPVLNYIYPAVLTMVGAEQSMRPDLEALLEGVTRSTERISKKLKNIFPHIESSRTKKVYVKS
ncbi:MAG TPA: IclR family transcriptional regulator [Dehalococcoidales bacterium]|nr:IclR family transcriptional regulator [Dehalococcoidales bacterium]